jgi:hypothetical protein
MKASRQILKSHMKLTKGKVTFSIKPAFFGPAAGLNTETFISLRRVVRKLPFRT